MYALLFLNTCDQPHSMNSRTSRERRRSISQLPEVERGLGSLGGSPHSLESLGCRITYLGMLSLRCTYNQQVDGQATEHRKCCESSEGCCNTVRDGGLNCTMWRFRRGKHRRCVPGVQRAPWICLAHRHPQTRPAPSAWLPIMREGSNTQRLVPFAPAKVRALMVQCWKDQGAQMGAPATHKPPESPS